MSRPTLSAPRRYCLNRVAATTVAAAALAVGLPSGTASAQQGWAQVEGEARAILPAPSPRSGFTRAELNCAAQIWTLELAAETGTDLLAMAGEATLLIGNASFVTTARSAAGRVEVAVPFPAIEPMRAGIGMSVGLAGIERPVEFGLSGSRIAITAAERLCTPRDLPSADAITLTPYSSYLALAQRLRKEDIDDFIASTSATPQARAGMLELGNVGRILFSELCGSSWYFGTSGCSIVGFVPAEGGDPAAASGWRAAFESQGAHLYVDRNAETDGWPALRALPVRQGDETRFTWTGEAYAPARASQEARDGIVEGLRK